MQGELCICGHPKHFHHDYSGQPRYCGVSSCDCQSYKKAEQKEEPRRCIRCGHTEEDHHRHPAGEGFYLRHCRIQGCSCQCFTTDLRHCPEPQVVFARFWARRATAEGWYEFQWLVNPKDVSSILTTETEKFSLISMKNGTEAHVMGTIDEVEEKLREAR